MIWLVAAAGVIFFCFSLVVLRGAPYLPTLKKQVAEAFDLLDLPPGSILLELGSGDGRLLRYAAERGVYSVGYELNPLLVWYTRLRHWRFRRFIEVRWGDFWQADWPESDAMYVFLLDKYMEKLDKKVIRYLNGKKYKLVSFGFEISSRKPTKQMKGLRLYRYN